MSRLGWGLLLVIMSVGALPALGNTIVPNDDAYIQSNSNSTPHDSLGVRVRTDSPRHTAYIEFTIPAEVATATAASFDLYQTATTMTRANISFKSQAGITIDETTLTWNNRPDLAPPTGQGATFLTVVCGPWQPPDGTTGPLSFDVLNWLKANAGNVVTIKVRNDAAADNPPTVPVQGMAIFEDREDTVTGNTANGPHIDWVPIPEPSGFLTMVLVGTGLLLRRRCK